MVFGTAIALLLAAATSTTFASPLVQRQSVPSVTIENGTLLGSEQNGVESFLSIPFAEPPVGNLRLRAPVPWDSNFGVLNATTPPAACFQYYFKLTEDPSLGQLPGALLAWLTNTDSFRDSRDESEDCLYLNVIRPAGTTAEDKLPVMFYIFGGAWQVGWASMYDGLLANFVNASVQYEKPVVSVVVGYRVNGYGFMSGRELAAESNTNLGLRDQRLGLQWVQDNIAAFGGDPTQVTIFGESAGSMSVFYQMAINGGDNTYKGNAMFKGAIMDSGSMLPTQAIDSPKGQRVFDLAVEYGGCGNATDKLACLRGLGTAEFRSAIAHVPGIFGYAGLDVQYTPRPDTSDDFLTQSPDDAVVNGNWAKVPLIVGDQEDEGTLFTLFNNNMTTAAEVTSYFAGWFPQLPDAVDVVGGLVACYPNQGDEFGSPFRTGDDNTDGKQHKRLAAVLGDILFNMNRRNFLALVSQDVPAWSFLGSYYWNSSSFGTFHATDLFQVFNAFGNQTVPVVSMQRYYLSFIYDQDPNAILGGAPLINWPQWKASSPPQMIQFNARNNTLLDDTFRQAAGEYLWENRQQLRV